MHHEEKYHIAHSGHDHHEGNADHAHNKDKKVVENH
jgi:hypothetical protein